MVKSGYRPRKSGSFHQVQEIRISAHQVLRARRDGEVQVGFVIRVASVREIPRNLGDQDRLGLNATACR